MNNKKILEISDNLEILLFNVSIFKFVLTIQQDQTAWIQQEGETNRKERKVIVQS